MKGRDSVQDIKIFLASGSPRRRELLEQMGICFEIKVSDVDENTDDNLSPSETVEILSARKADVVFEELVEKLSGNFAVIGSDTVVAADEKILGKPKDKNEAFEMLSMLKGKKHTVYTGLTVMLYYNSKVSVSTLSSATDVYIRNLTDCEINDYINTGEPLDKAGAYGIQGKGAIIVGKIDGDYYTVVGLPVSRLYTIFRDMGIPIKIK